MKTTLPQQRYKLKRWAPVAALVLFAALLFGAQVDQDTYRVAGSTYGRSDGLFQDVLKDLHLVIDGAVIASFDSSLGGKFTTTTPMWDDLRVPLESTRAGGAAPTYAQFQDNGAASTGVFAWSFVHTAEKEVHFATQLPHAYKEGTDLKPHVHWSPADTTAGAVTWGLEYTIHATPNDGAAFATTTIITGSDTSSGTALGDHIAPLGTITGTGFQASAVIKGRLFRDHDDAGDTMDAAAFAHEIDFHYQTDSAGSYAEYGD